MQAALPWLKGYHRSGESQGLDLIAEFVLTNSGKIDNLLLPWNEHACISAGEEADLKSDFDGRLLNSGMKLPSEEIQGISHLIPIIHSKET